MLSKEEVVYAMTKVRALAPGAYTVKEVFGSDWELNYRPRHYVKRFKAAVFHGDLPGVCWRRKRSDRSHEYDVKPSTES